MITGEDEGEESSGEKSGGAHRRSLTEPGGDPASSALVLAGPSLRHSAAMSDQTSPFEHSSSFEAGELTSSVRLGRFEAHYEELFAEVIEDGVITAEERAQLDRTAERLGLDRDRLHRLELALEAAYETRHCVRIREEAAEEEDEHDGRSSIAPIEPSSEPGVQLFQKRIAFLEARVAELEAALEEARANVAVKVDLAGTAPVIIQAESLDDPEDLLRHLRHDPRDQGVLRALYRVFGRIDDADRRWCAAQALTYLGAASEEERTFYQQHRGEGLIRPRAALEKESFRRFLFHPEEESLIGEIFAVIIGPVLLGRLAARRRDKSLPHLDPAHKQDPATSTLQAVRCFSWGAAILGMPTPTLFADPEYAGSAEIVPGVVPATRLGKQALSGRTPTELAFLAGRHLSFYREDHFVRALLPSIPDLEDIFLAALSIGNPGLPLGTSVKARVKPIAEAISPILEPLQVDRLRGHFLRFVEEGGRTNLQRWATAVDCTAARAGLLLSNDLEASRAMIALGDPAGVEERMDDLLVFVTSERYAKLRKQLGVAVGG